MPIQSSTQQQNSYKYQQQNQQQQQLNNGTTNNNSQFDSPKAIKKITSTPNVVNAQTNGNYTNGISNGNGMTETNANGSALFNYDKLKQELIVEFRKELQTMKSDIINCKSHFFFN